MVCAFSADGPTAASFVSSSELACASPSALAVDRRRWSHTVDLRVSLDGRRFSAPGEAAFHVTNAAATPVLSRLTPSLGPAAGGTMITMRGRGFAPGALATLWRGTRGFPVRCSCRGVLRPRPSAPFVLTSACADGRASQRPGGCSASSKACCPPPLPSRRLSSCDAVHVRSPFPPPSSH